jgi:hypothetical protein
MAQDGSGQKNKQTEKGRGTAALFPVFLSSLFCPQHNRSGLVSFVAFCANPFLLS